MSHQSVMDKDHHLDSEEPPSHIPAFDLDGRLGGLAKWLRIVGFDAAFPRKAPSRGRIFVTMRPVEEGLAEVVVDDVYPVAQLKHVIDQLGIVIREDLLLTRCLLCNVPVREIWPDQAAGRVPEPILRTMRTFHECPQCRRVYWEGSHRDRIRERLADERLSVSYGA